MKLKFLISLLVFSVMFLGCGGGSDEESSNTVIEDYGLNGSWDMYINGTDIADATIEGLNFTKTFPSLYSNDILVSIFGSSTLDGNKLAQPNDINVTLITIVYKTASASIISQLEINNANSNAACGYTNWQLYVPKDITNTDCAVPDMFFTIKDIYSLSESILTWGHMQGLDSNGYPEGLNLNKYWIKK